MLSSRKTRTVSKNTEDYAYLRFSGPRVNDGKIDLGQAGKTLVALNKWFKKYKKEYIQSEGDIVLRAGGIQKGSSEVQLFLDFIQNNSHATALTVTLIGGSVFKNLGFRDFFQKFMGTVGKQLALKLFAKGKDLKEIERFAKDGKALVKVANNQGKRKVVDAQDWDVYKKTGQQLNGFCNLEEGKEEKMTVGYYNSDSKEQHELIALDFRDREFFQDINDPEEWARRLSEPFDESKAKDMKIVGQFIDYYGLAHKYHFSFQARKEQDIHGKQKILCILDEEKIPEVIDMLKPQNRKNVCIMGAATTDRDGKTDKIKISWFNEDPDYNPDQISIM